MRRIVLAFAGAALLAAAPASAQDAAEFVVRMNRVEGQMRQLSGQVEQLQFENRQLKDQLRKFQEDVEFRFNERPGANRSSAASPPAAAPPAPSTPSAPAARPVRRGDAFDPGLNPAAPGAPRTLGSAPSADAPRGGIAAIIEEDGRPEAPLDLSGAGRTTPPAAPPRVAAAPTPGGSDDPRADYDMAYAYLIQKQYEGAETGFRRFIQAHPRDRLVADATYWLGESYLQRNRPREAAEQFLKVSTEFARSAKAPDALLKLGVSLTTLGAKDQACATFAEVERKYPSASASVRQGVERERTRARCPA